MVFVTNRGVQMKEHRKIDLSKLLGFDLVSDEILTNINLREHAFGARLGAKVGDKVLAAPDLPRDSRAPRT
jgi:hypothetical protein